MNSKEEIALYQRLLSEHESDLLRLCMLYTDRSVENVRDLYQEIAYQLWQSLPNYHGKSALDTWVYSVALKTARNHYRKQRRHVDIVPLNPKTLEEVSDHLPDELTEQLYELIDLLNPEERMLIFLYLEKKKQKEIGAVLGITERAVNERLRRLKEKLIKLKRYEDSR